MDIQFLHEFALLAERLNFTSAARALNISTSTLCRHIASLEAELGVRLFTRGRKTSLTYPGKILLEEAGELFAAEQRVSNRLLEAKRSIQGNVRLEDYFFSRSIKNLLLTAAKHYRRMYPGVTFEFVPIGNGPSMEELLESGEIDVGVLVHTGPERPVFLEGEDRVIPLWGERGRMGIYTRRDQLLSNDVIDGEVTINVLRRLPVVMPLRPEYGNFRNDITSLCAAHGFDVGLKLLETGSLEDLAMLDMRGCAQIVLDTDLRDPDSPFLIDPDCQFLPIRERCWAVPYLLFADRPDDRTLSTFADFLREVIDDRREKKRG